MLCAWPMAFRSTEPGSGQRPHVRGAPFNAPKRFLTASSLAARSSGGLVYVWLVVLLGRTRLEGILFEALATETPSQAKKVPHLPAELALEAKKLMIIAN